jgi:hypothetical protein
VFVVATTAYAVASIPFTRFYFYGTDLVGEYFAAQTTMTLARWPVSYISLYDTAHIGGGVYAYFSSLAITILPTMVAITCSVPMMSLFKAMTPAVITLITLTSYVVFRRIFGRRIASLSVILLIFQNIYLGTLPNLLREDVALVFLLWTIYFLVRKDKNSHMIGLFTFSALVAAHYTMIYFALAFISLMLFANRIRTSLDSLPVIGSWVLPKTNRLDCRPIITSETFLYTIVVGLVWLVFIVYPLFGTSIIVLRRTAEEILGYVPSTYSIYTRYAVFSSLGLFNTLVQWVTRILAATGLIIVLRKSIKIQSFSVGLMGGIMMLLLVIWVVIPEAGTAFFVDRIYSIALLFFSIFIAVSLLCLIKRCKQTGVLLSVAIILLILLESVSFPAFVYSHSSLEPVQYVNEPYYQLADVNFAFWYLGHTRETSLSLSDMNSLYTVRFLANRSSIAIDASKLVSPDRDGIISLLDRTQVTYFVIVERAPGYMVIYDTSTGRRIDLNLDPSSTFQNDPTLNRAYDNDNNLLFCTT